MYERILRKIRPTEDEVFLMDSVARKLNDQVLKEIKEYPEIINAEYAGSYAKDTWLTGDSDLDLFLVFKNETSEGLFESTALDVGFITINNLDGHAYTRYADHPFVEGEVDGVKVNIVPCYNSPLDNLKSDTDRTPYHTAYMKKALAGKSDEVRLLKYFLKQTAIYGSDIKIQGFSGYSCEVLIAWYGSFQRVIEAFAKINEGEIIGVSYKKFNTPITIIDPIDSNRNLASAFSSENIGKFILYSRKLLGGDLSLFDGVKEPDIRRFGDVVKVQFLSPNGSPDKIWGQINRTVKALKTQVEKFGFKVVKTKSDILSNIVVIELAFETIRLPDYEVRKGPQVFDEKSVDSFTEKNRGWKTWIGDDLRIYVLKQRLFDNAKSCIEYVLKSGVRAGIPETIVKCLGTAYTSVS